MKTNQMKLTFDARSVNESFARVSVAAFLTELNPTLDELADVKTAVSEAVTNSIIHAYESEKAQIQLYCKTYQDAKEKLLEVIIEDKGKGIADVEKAMEAMKAAGEDAYIVGKVEAGEKGVTLC